MAIDLVCGQCQGRFVADEPGSVVACPHCGTHLHVPGEAAEIEPSPAVVDSAPRELVTSDLEAAEDHPTVAAAPLETAALVSVDASLLEEETPEQPGFAPQAEQIPAAIEAVSTPLTETTEFTVPAAAVSAAIPMIQTGAPVPPATVPRFWFMVVASYASAMTLAFVFTLIQFAAVKSHQLESLPDVVPKIKNGEVALQVVPPEANVPKGHVLALGESQRYGNLRVTPLRVTQGPLRFEHLLKDPTAARPPSEPVLKLWMRFENISWNQNFAPLDPLLLFKRHYGDFGARVLTNQFLCRADQRQRDGDLRHVYELSPTSEFHIAGQNLDTVLEPGATLETFVPSEERIADLTGDLVWRVQFRKGYHPRSRHGVTTLIDIPFHRNDVTMEN